MSHAPKTIIAVSPGRNRMGVAVFRDGNLLYYGGISLRKYRTKPAVLQAVDQFIDRASDTYQISHLALLELNKQQTSSPLLPEIVERLKVAASEKQIEFNQYKALFIRGKFCSGKRATKENTAQTLICHYPEMNKYFSSKTGWQRRYYDFVFDAVALGSVCALNLENAREESNPL